MRPSAKKKPKSPGLATKVSSKEFNHLELELLGIPLESSEAFPELNESERILFQRCSEIYRIAEHFSRRREFLLQVYSEYRTRNHFEDVLKTHYFDTDERLTPEFDPEFYSVILGTYHFIRSVSLSLRHTTSLPRTLDQELIWAEANLIKTWNRIAGMAREKYGWKLKTL